MFFYCLLFTIGSVPSYALSGDGKTLHIQGEGEVSQSDVNLAGNKDEYITIIIRDATSLGNSAFERCSKLISISLDESIQSIGSSCFKWCICLESFIFPSKVTDVKSEMFMYCRSLQSVYISSSIQSISNCAVFCDCEKLQTIDVNHRCCRR